MRPGAPPCYRCLCGSRLHQVDHVWLCPYPCHATARSVEISKWTLARDKKIREAR